MRAPDLARLDDAVCKLDISLVRMMAGSGTKQESLGLVYILNQEMGRIVRDFPDLAPALRAMQSEVNMVTVETKREEFGSALAWLRLVSASLGRVEAATGARTSSALGRDL